MRGIVEYIRVLALALGAPGLFLVAFLDSSILSLPEVADLLVVYMVTRHKARMLLYAGSATLGSIAGCVVLYLLAQKGEDALVRRHLASGTVQKTLARFERWGAMAVLIPSLLPPPAPFKIFVLLAGAAGISLPRFAAAIAVGRGLRYVAIGFLAIRYGEQTIAFVHDHGTAASLAVVGLLVAGLAGYVIWSRAQAGNAARMDGR
ncbi:MAG TPA: VTT domain-containing protein [Vicinamibacterales bacterium]|nr:VTT domain-containing protein [Vicinamibacterales bacterium]